jgi:hypothetical protein
MFGTSHAGAAWYELSPSIGDGALFIDLDAKRVYSSPSCERSWPLSSLEVNKTGFIARSETSGAIDLPARGVPFKERVEIEISKRHGTITLYHSLASGPIEVALNARRLGRSPCR